MRIRRQAAAFRQLLPEILQIFFIQPAFEIRPRIHARRGVTLEINLIAGKILRGSAKKMVERHFVKRRRGRERRNVPTDVCRRVRLDHHCHRVPAHDALDAAFDDAVAGIFRLVRRRDRVDVRRRQAGGRLRRGAQFLRHFFKQLRGALIALAFKCQFKNRPERFR